MAWDEWEQLKTAAAESRSTGMRLNQLPGDQGGGGGTAGDAQGDLKVTQSDLAAIGDKAFKLYNRLWKEARVAVPSSDKAAGDLTTQGFALGAALQHVSVRWEDQLKSLMDACAHISNHMDYTKNAHAGDEHFIQGQLSSIAMLDQGFDEAYGEPGKKNKGDD
ncbi:hypothetical protein [Streptomyces sp. SID3212]|uniref:hypothetical protein n=1 Tax=Streptomyces sp. SID3212 TaxID=2690259 RepID=UPI0013715617|nr:hypothetical protein [Streptomyces sp. SID3212]MYV57972.1 hypothetical protein [Streptomyces sp. SID3212]